MGNTRLVIAGTHSGVGKTSLTLALAHALTRRGTRVQTFKVGPDFLDPSYLALASGRPCYNLDGWMCGREYVAGLFARAARAAGVFLVEGVMGLFDGADAASSEGSTAEIARWLDAPVLLVTNAHGLARSLAAVVKGFCTFESGLRFAGVVANQAGSERHTLWLADALRSADLPPLLGAIPRGAFPDLPSRHLGLVTASQETLSAGVLDQLADALERHVSIEAVLQAGRTDKDERDVKDVKDERDRNERRRLRLGVAHDKAFHFYYPDTLEALEAHGCELVRFSPLTGTRLPQDLAGVYLGGGYPEVYAAELSANAAMLQDIRSFAESGRALYAECGGLMYLSQGIQTQSGQRHALAGVLPVWTRMLPQRKALGYVEVELSADALWGPCGATVRGHEFHYSEMLGEPEASAGWKKVYRLRRRRATEIVSEGFQRGNVLASYVHAHLASRPEAVANFVRACEVSR